MAAISGGQKLQAALAKISAGVSKPATLSVGFLEGSTASNGDSIPLRAALNEFGTKNMPPRPFFRSMVASKSPEWPKAVGDLLKANDYDGEKTLGQAGEAIKGQLQQSITDLMSPPLAESTIKRKGFDKPLIEHGDMLNAVDFTVKS
ncbi:MAG TPA: hypothetical protein VIO16_10755 [Dehalococcoidia bacterium]